MRRRSYVALGPRGTEQHSSQTEVEQGEEGEAGMPQKATANTGQTVETNDFRAKMRQQPGLLLPVCSPFSLEEQRLTRCPCVYS